MPNFAKGDYFVQEFAYVQFTTDFEKVMFGTPEQVALNKAKQAEQDIYVQSEQEKAADEERAQKKAEKNKRKREKQKQKALEAKEAHAQI